MEFDDNVSNNTWNNTIEPYYDSANETVDDSYEIPHPATEIFFAMQICILFIGLIGNITACFVMACSKDMHTPMNFYLFNLSVSDVLYLIIATPSHLYGYYEKEVYTNNAVCFLSRLVSEMSMNASLLTVTVLAGERYLAICHPFVARSLTRNSRVISIIITIWLISGFCAFIMTMKTGLQIIDGGRLICAFPSQPYVIEVLMAILFFLLPMAATCVFYSLIVRQVVARKKINNNQIDIFTRKTLKITAVIAASFFICWVPFLIHRQMVVQVYWNPDIDPNNYEIYFKVFEYLYVMAKISSLLSTAVNPIIYTFMSENFRKAFKELLSKCFLKHRQDARIT